MSELNSHASGTVGQEAGTNAGPVAAPRTRKMKKTKSDAIVALLTRARGATLDDMMKATGWQAHAVRGFLAGTLKKKLGRSVASDVTDRGRVYRIAPEAQ